MSDGGRRAYVEEIESDVIRAWAKELDEHYDIDAGGKLGDYVYIPEHGVLVIETTSDGFEAFDGICRSATFDDAAKAVERGKVYLDDRRNGETGHSDFPISLQGLLYRLDLEGFRISYGAVGERNNPAFLAEHDDGTVIEVTDRVQTWFVTLRSPDRPDVDECWESAMTAGAEIKYWLKEYPED